LPINLRRRKKYYSIHEARQTISVAPDPITVREVDANQRAKRVGIHFECELFRNEVAIPDSVLNKSGKELARSTFIDSRGHHNLNLRRDSYNKNR
jgi:hypothetical protein